MAYITNTLTVIITIVTCVSPNGYDYSYNPYIKEYTSNVTLKQGVLQGVIVEPKIGRDEKYRVGVFRGIPYAAPPVGGLRFMPTVGAPSWFGVKYADNFGPVCPQKFPDEKKMPPFRKEHFLRLKEYLKNQSEDCLYLNIYAPIPDNELRKYPVMVFISGESFEWNSGNPYDGSVLAAYGNVIVVTINFRLGILGFLKAGTEEMSKSNFGLVDQIASLVWIKDNIGAFGGDTNSVTLFGHGTGAVCASLLMISPMVLKGNDRLFHRAILMGGTALADWALAGNPSEVTYQVAKALNCQIHDDFAECLRRKRLDEIMAAGAITPDYKTRFGPVVDSLVVPNDPKKSMTQYNDIFRRFELMYGVSEQESINLLDPLTFTQGMLLKERDKELRTYFRSRCEMKPELCLQRTLDEYGQNDNSQNNVGKEDRVYDYSGFEPDEASLARNALLDILSDARSVAPIVQMARYHATVNMQSYFYVFKHRTHSRDYIRDKTYSGEELPYVFGVPLDGPKFHFVDSYTEQERLFSEIVMMYFSNFAETGNPNVPRKESFSSMGPAYWAQFDVEWPEFDVNEERYLELKIPPQPSQHYRKSEMNYWNNEFPTITENFTYDTVPMAHPTKKPVFYIPSTNPQLTPRPWLYTHLTEQFQKNKFENFEKPLVRTSNNVFGTVINAGIRSDSPESDVYGKIIESPPKEVKQGSTMNIVTIAGGLFLLANILILGIIYFKCRNRRKANKEDEIPQPPNGDKVPKDEDGFVLNGCNIVRMMNKSSKSEDTYEAVRPDSNPSYKLTRQMSGSTIDAHTKVREWITQEIIQKYSPRIFRKNRRSEYGRNHTLIPEKFTGMDELGKASTLPRDPAMKTSTITRPKVPKVSVAVDATPSGRGPSVLMQRPIELSKSFDLSYIGTDTSPPLRRSMTLEDFTLNKHMDQSVDASNYDIIEPMLIKIEHKHSNSDPVQDPIYAQVKKFKTFSPHEDVSVTCRDEVVPRAALTPEESLNIIKRRNFPKVLPDYPDRLNNRRSMPVTYLTPVQDSKSLQSNFAGSFNKLAPTPPPRTTTLTKQTSEPQPVFLSEPTLPEEPEDEPEIVCNNLYIGPLIPKNKSDPKISEHLKDAETKKLKSAKDTETKDSKIVESKTAKEAEVKAKTIISPHSNPKRADPKVVIKPTLSKKPSEEKCGKAIARVVVPDNQPYQVPSISKDTKEGYIEDKMVDIPKESTSDKTANKTSKKSQIPTLIKTPSINKESSSSESSPSEESDTGTVVKKV